MSGKLSLLCHHEVQSKLDAMQMEVKEQEQRSKRREQLRQENEIVTTSKTSVDTGVNPLEDPLEDPSSSEDCEEVVGEINDDDSDEDLSFTSVSEPNVPGPTDNDAQWWGNNQGDEKSDVQSDVDEQGGVDEHGDVDEHSDVDEHGDLQEQGGGRVYRPVLKDDVCLYNYPKMFGKQKTAFMFRFGSMLFATSTSGEASNALGYMRAVCVPPGDAEIPCTCGESFEAMIPFCYHVTHGCIPLPDSLDKYAMENIPLAFILRAPALSFLKCIAQVFQGLRLDILNPRVMPSNTYWITDTKENVYECTLIDKLEKNVRSGEARPSDIIELVEKKNN